MSVKTFNNKELDNQSISINVSEESKQFTLLHEINTILTSSLNLKDTLSRLFDTLDENMNLKKAVLTLTNPYTSELRIEVAYGITEKELHHASFENWKKINEEVLSTEKAKIVEMLDDKDPLLGESEKSVEESFICLPLTLGKEKIGTLSIKTLFENRETLYQNVRLLSIVTLMLSQEVKLKRLMETEKAVLRSENIKLKDELTKKYNIHNMIGKSSEMYHVYENIKQVANSTATVLIRGESGTGKELVSHAIHYNSSRKDSVFIRINCGAIPESLIESELFGYEKGAFTDAHHQKIGKFEASSNGTIFLDEIGELSPAMQVKLLRVLQEKEVTRIGGIQPIKVNLRVITATNKDLETAVKNNEFREDLYYRLNVFPIFIPSLRERKADIVLLAEHFLEKYSKENEKNINRISSKAIDLLTNYHWPGNVRELENCMERCVIVCDSKTIQASHLPPTLQKNEIEITVSDKNLSFQEIVQNFEAELIKDALKNTNGNKAKAARYLKTTQRIIGYKIKQYNIEGDFQEE
ncbi:sigma-54-dependent Fis family transcriptional regulator [Candidatus Marinamargulisbacteria bacterium SCGC AG-410-N11]|nr:sigma-54-dependent Fis family transcriptional regulator [Candidatus Marinamargulisbacteria bacterium SCGC AG-410-N11]